jgi:hypothetical protein
MINRRYAPSKDETELGLRASDPEWFEGYTFFDESILQKPEEWREQQVLEWFAQYGRDFFKDLDIWDIDWGRRENRF